MKKIVIAAATCLLALSTDCTDSDGGRRVLEGQGYTNITMGGHAWFDCGKDDEVSNTFDATHPISKKRVSGAVCRGYNFGCGKNWTVRISE